MSNTSGTFETGTPTFGEAIDQLEAIVAQLEGDETLGLETSLALFERGLGLAHRCREQLAAAQLRLTQIAVAPAAESDE
ncbi:MAG: exodeoxyribonuclease VII small subunit [Chloroflexi bacterium]|nr:exodeoxyribonuclease VII small subunit [Chloroflexota bacterium]